MGKKKHFLILSKCHPSKDFLSWNGLEIVLHTESNIPLLLLDTRLEDCPEKRHGPQKNLS